MTTVDRNGQPNAGPFSFFNVLTNDPAIVAIGVENYADMRFKDTARNIRETGEFNRILVPAKCRTDIKTNLVHVLSLETIKKFDKEYISRRHLLIKLGLRRVSRRPIKGIDPAINLDVSGNRIKFYRRTEVRDFMERIEHIC